MALGVLFATIFLDFVGFSILIPVLPIHLEKLGADAVDIGMVLALSGALEHPTLGGALRRPRR